MRENSKNRSYRKFLKHLKNRIAFRSRKTTAKKEKNVPNYSLLCGCSENSKIFETSQKTEYFTKRTVFQRPFNFLPPPFSTSNFWSLTFENSSSRSRDAWSRLPRAEKRLTKEHCRSLIVIIAFQSRKTTANKEYRSLNVMLYWIQRSLRFRFSLLQKTRKNRSYRKFLKHLKNRIAFRSRKTTAKKEKNVLKCS